MFTHYLKIALRNLLKNKIQSIVSIVGLSVGFISISVSLLWVRYETTFDTSYPCSENIYKVIRTLKNTPNTYAQHAYGAVAEKIMFKYPEVEAATVTSKFDLTIEKDEIKIRNLKADTSFFNVFDIPFIIGSKETALKQPASIILTESAAIKLFGSAEAAIGRALNAKSHLSVVPPQYIVNGVIKDVQHTQFQFEALVPISQSERQQYDTESNDHFEIYVLLKNNIDKKAFVSKISDDNNLFIMDWEREYYSNFTAAPLSHLHYKYDLQNRTPQTFNYTYMLILIAVALLLFICTIFNHISIFISLSYTRIKNLGLRKAIGSSNNQLLVLLLAEFLVSIIIAFVISICLIEIIRPILEKQLDIVLYSPLMFSAISLIVIVGIIISLLLVAYPVYIICSIAVKHSLAGKKLGTQQKTQKTLIVIQLIISVFFIFITSNMYRQLRYINVKERGIDIQNVLRIDDDVLEDKKKLIYNDLLESPYIEKIIKDVVPGVFDEKGRQTAFEDLKWEGDEGVDKSSINFVSVDYGFTDFFNVKIKNGRSFVQSPAEDRSKMIISEKVARMMGGNPIGKTITYHSRPYEVIGIIDDLDLRSFKYEPRAVIISYFDIHAMGRFIRYTPNTLKKTINYINEVYKKHDGKVYELTTIDEILKSYNKSDATMMRIISIIALICTLISIFGVYSLTLFTMEQRRRELAIRKVMGASVSNIIRMFFKEYVWLVIIASIIAIPPAYYIMDKWLQTYANRIGIAWWLIIGIIIIITIIVISTVLRQIVKAANSNPAEVIKYE